MESFQISRTGLLVYTVLQAVIFTLTVLASDCKFVRTRIKLRSLPTSKVPATLNFPEMSGFWSISCGVGAVGSNLSSSPSFLRAFLKISLSFLEPVRENHENYPRQLTRISYFPWLLETSQQNSLCLETNRASVFYCHTSFSASAVSNVIAPLIAFSCNTKS